MHSISLLALLSLSAFGEKPLILDDFAIIKGFEKSAGELAEKEETVRVTAVLETLENPVGLTDTPKGDPPRRVEDSIFAIGAVYDCGKCDKWHLGSLATAWVLGSDGIFCSNYHVVEGLKGEVAAVTSAQGETYEVIEVLLADKANDIVVFRADVSGLAALPLAKEPAPVGEEVYCVSHPDKRFYTRTFGEVSRYFMKRVNREEKVPVMGITAEYARGSSGGPILNAKNEVVGMVSSTNSIHADKKGKKEEKIFQMVVRNCVPTFQIQKLLNADSRGEKRSTPE